jgi:ubiquinone biosynthesis protein COQ9
MIAPPERSAERDAAITAMLPHVATQGWTYAALRSALREAGHDPRDAELLFPGGTPDMIEAYLDLADRRMEEEAAATDWTGLSLTKRMRRVIALRFEQSRPHREAARRAAGLLALPWRAGLAARCTARTVDAIWHAAGDRSADFSWYTKRAILGGVYTATLLRWLGDTSEDDAATLAFLDRRLADVGQIGKFRRRFEDTFGRLCSRCAAS